MMHLIIAKIVLACGRCLFKILFDRHSAHARACSQTPAINCRGEVSEAAGRAFADGERGRWLSRVRGPLFLF